MNPPGVSTLSQGSALRERSVKHELHTAFVRSSSLLYVEQSSHSASYSES